jgi:hypothetical protein
MREELTESREDKAKARCAAFNCHGRVIECKDDRDTLECPWCKRTWTSACDFDEEYS